MANELAKHGVTSFCPTSMTLPQKRLEKIVETISEYKSENHKGSKIAGINLEGPYIAMGKKARKTVIMYAQAQQKNLIPFGKKQFSY